MNHSSFSGADSGIVRKRQHAEISDDDDTSMTDDSDDLGISQYFHEEIDLELAIRERLATTIEGRIQWALLLLDSLTRVGESNTDTQTPDTDEFQDAALDAYEALEAPSAFLFDPRTSEEESEASPRSFSPLVMIPQQSQRVSKTRSSRTPKPSNQKRLLYIKLPSAASDSQLAVLSCPTCCRTQFSTLQGLLNHARLAHGVEWASHDACISACAAQTNPDDLTWETIEQDGVEVPWGGNVVGLRRLFERAVGVDGNLPTPLVEDAGQTASLKSGASIPSTLLSRTLGLHADSPALAPFLGRAPKRRCIHAYNEDDDVDIVTAANGPSAQEANHIPGVDEHRAKRFRMAYPHRSAARADLDLVVDVDTVTSEDTDDQTAHATTHPVPDSSTSRFHITARVRLEDRSLYLTEERRLCSPHTYRWMLGVTSPSYSLPLASFLTCVRVIPPLSVSRLPLSVQQQPFAVIGTANESFLARVIMEWVGGGKMEVEHWVDLDQSKSGSSVAGSEQMFDVELDRNTPLLPEPREAPPSLPSLDRYSTPNASQNVTSELSPENTSPAATSESGHETILRSLLPRVPMTAKGVSRTNPSVPYKLVASPAHLLALVPGRRKAIEWGRARALHALYVEHIASSPSPEQIPLTVGDVYAFLEDASLFPRPSMSTPALPEGKKKGKEKAREDTPGPGEAACSVCGIKKRLHPGYAVKTEEGAIRWTCAIVPLSEQQRGAKFPLINLSKMFALPGGLERAILDRDFPRPTTGSELRQNPLPAFRYSSRGLVAFSSPDLILAVQKSVETLRLPRFPSFPLYAQRPAFLNNRERTEQSLAPSALLSVTLKPFISTLVRSALEVAKRDVASISGPPSTVTAGGKTGRPKKGKKIAFVLTPGHILRGLQLPPPPEMSRPVGFGYLPGVKEAVALCLARVGVPLHFGRGKSVTDQCQESGVTDLERSEGPGLVKVEPL
ncbi:hypothetical protein F5I97DRAFT_1928904 [Phlebopus sp. FC_14]|nr:hypothetical protein F5I97DRAFT_1928904 [Phlebopus sp. FC_14]